MREVTKLNHRTTRLSNYLELARVSNLPTCVTNVMVGTALANGPQDSRWGVVVLCSAAVGLLYVFGMVLNDIVDVDVDRLERPHRPIPSGRISLRGAYLFAALSAAGGAILLAVCGTPSLLLGLILIGAIVAYNLLHKRHSWSAVLMGVCRALVYLVAAAAVAWPLNWRLALGFSGALAVYIIALSAIAQRELDRLLGWRRSLCGLLAGAALLPLVVVRPTQWVVPIACGSLLWLWLGLSTRHLFGDQRQPQKAVLGFLAGICLLDAFFLTLLDRMVEAVIAVLALVITVRAHRHILGT